MYVSSVRTPKASESSTRYSRSERILEVAASMSSTLALRGENCANALEWVSMNIGIVAIVCLVSQCTVRKSFVSKASETDSSEEAVGRIEERINISTGEKEGHGSWGLERALRYACTTRSPPIPMKMGRLIGIRLVR